MKPISVHLPEDEKVIACRLFFEAVLPGLAATINALPDWRSIGPGKGTLLLTGPYATGCQLSFDEEAVVSAPWAEGQFADLWLHFEKPDQVIQLLRGGQSFPKIKKGWKHLPQLIRFDRLTKKFQDHLKGSREGRSDSDLRQRALSLLNIAIRGTIILSECDPRALALLGHTGPGTIALNLQGESLAVLEWSHWRLWQLQPSELKGESASATIRFQSIQDLLEILEEEADPLVALAKGGIDVSGRIPLADAFSALLDRLSYYTT